MRRRSKVFPVVLDVKNPRFYNGLERLVDNNAALSAVDATEAPVPLKILRKLPHWVANGAQMASLFFMAPIRSEQFHPSVR